MKVDIWMPIYLGDYLKDTRHLATVDHGAYFLILMELWDKGGKIPLKNLHRIALLSKTEWPETWEIISDFFEQKDGMIWQKRLTEELIKSQSRRDASKENGLKGGRPKTVKKAKKKPNGKPRKNLSVNLNPNLDPNLEKSSSSSPSPSPTKSTVSLASKARKPDIIWDSVCNLWSLKPQTKNELSLMGKIVKDLKLKGATPEGIEKHKEHFQTQWKGVTCTPSAVLKHWDLHEQEIKERKNKSSLDGWLS